VLKKSKTEKLVILTEPKYSVGDILTTDTEIAGVPPGTKFEIIEVKKGLIYRAKWLSWEKIGEEFLIEEAAIK
jgi:hypothetical protein